jgi:hypothetical protein
MKMKHAKLPSCAFDLHLSSFRLHPSSFHLHPSISATNELGKRNGNVTKTVVQEAAGMRGPCGMVRFAQLKDLHVDTSRTAA